MNEVMHKKSAQAHDSKQIAQTKQQDGTQEKQTCASLNLYPLTFIHSLDPHIHIRSKSFGFFAP